MMYRRIVLVVAAVMLVPASAWACEVASLVDADLPPDGATVGPRPTMLTDVIGEPELTRLGDDARIALEAVPELSGLDAQSSTRAVTAWRPGEPLADGNYVWHFGLTSFEARFLVVGSLADAPIIAHADFHVLLGEPDDGGLFGSDNSCSDIDPTRMDIEVTGNRVQGLLVELSDPRGDATLRSLVRSQNTTRFQVAFRDGERGYPSFKKKKVCVAVTAVSPSGILGERKELGCADPSEEGAHLTDERGCAGGSTSWVLLPLAAIVMVRRRRTS